MSLENLMRYETAAVASMNLRERPAVALTAIKNFYTNILGVDSDDPVINKAFAEGAEGVAQGLGISNSGIINAAGIYTEKYQNAYADMTVGQVLNYLGQDYQIPQIALDGLAQYQTTLIPELQDETASTAINLLRMRRLNNLGLNMEVESNNQMTTQALLNLYGPQSRAVA